MPFLATSADPAACTTIASRKACDRPYSTSFNLRALNLVFPELRACPALYSAWIGISRYGKLGPTSSCGTLGAALSSKSPPVTLRRCRRRWTTSCVVCARSTEMAIWRMGCTSPAPRLDASGPAQLKISIGSRTAKLAATANAPVTPQHHQSSSSFFSMARASRPRGTLFVGSFGQGFRANRRHAQAMKDAALRLLDLDRC